MYKNDNRIVATLDAGGTNFVFGAMKAGEFIIDPVSVPAGPCSGEVEGAAV